MNMGKVLMALTIVTAVAVGAGVWYAQEIAFYEDAPVLTEVKLTPLDGGDPQTIEVSDFEGIDRQSSPIAYRACFTVDQPLTSFTDRFEGYEGAAPRNAPFWFGCFDAKALGAELEDGRARVFSGERNVEFGIDRVVAITEDGHGYIWHEINECGDKAYDGTPLGEDCPERKP